MKKKWKTIKEALINLLSIYKESTQISFLVKIENQILSEQGQITDILEGYRLGIQTDQYSLYYPSMDEKVCLALTALLKREIENILLEFRDTISKFFEILTTVKLSDQEYVSLLKEFDIQERDYRIWYFEGENLDKEVLTEIMSAIWNEKLLTQVDLKGSKILFLIENSQEISSQDSASLVVEELSSQLMSKFYLFLSNTLTSYNSLFESAVYIPKMASLYKGFYPNRFIGFEDEFEIGLLFKKLSDIEEKDFIDKILGKDRYSVLEDEEMKATLYHFFRNNLSISETARSLFIHRNTLTYRLDKLSEKIGRDIRRFEEASLVYMAFILAQKD